MGKRTREGERESETVGGGEGGGAEGGKKRASENFPSFILYLYFTAVTAVRPRHNLSFS